MASIYHQQRRILNTLGDLGLENYVRLWSSTARASASVFYAAQRDCELAGTDSDEAMARCCEAIASDPALLEKAQQEFPASLRLTASRRGR